MSERARLLAPGLLGPVPQDLGLRDPPQAIHLERLLARADQLAGKAGGGLAVLFEAFGVAVPPGADLPSAPFCRLAEDPKADISGYWLHADPVHLRADRDRVRLFDQRFFDLAQAESDELVAAFNAHFSGPGLELLGPHPRRWLLHLKTAPALRTTPLGDAVGRSIEPLLPQGRDARRWIALLNEAQMLLHESPVNRRREAEGQPTINGIWIWGGGVLPGPGALRAPFRVCARAPLAQGLAHWAGLPLVEPADGLPPLVAPALGGERLIFWDEAERALQTADLEAWRTALMRLDTWLEPLSTTLRQGELTYLELDPGLGVRYRITRQADRRFWRRRSALLERVSVAG